MFRADAWWDDMIGALREARSVLIATYTYDDMETTQVLLSRLKSRAPFECRIVVDRKVAEANSTRFQRSRLKLLQEHHARIALADGHDATGVFGPQARGGSMHMKAVVIDGRIAYAGSANLTRQSRINKEVMFRITGPSVSELAQAILGTFDSARVKQI